MRHLRSPNLRKKRRKRIFLNSVFFVACILILTGAPALLLRIPGTHIREFEINGLERVEKKDIESILKENLEGNFFYMFPKSHALIYPEKRIIKKVEDNFPEVESIDIKLSSFHAIRIDIQERKTESLWCDGNVPSKCFSMDENGFIFAEGPIQSGNIYFMYSGFIEGEPIGQYFLPGIELEKVKSFVESVKLLGIDPVALSYVDKKNFELKIKGGGKILFLLDENESELLSNLDSLLRDSTLQIAENGELQVAVIDLRYGNKVILKKGEMTEESSNE